MGLVFQCGHAVGRHGRALFKRGAERLVAGLAGVMRLECGPDQPGYVKEGAAALKKKLQREGVFREMKLKQHFEKPSVKKAREQAEAVRRARKLARKKAQREGGL